MLSDENRNRLARMVADYDQSLVSCRDYLLRIGGPESLKLLQAFNAARAEGHEMGAFAVLGFQAAARTITDRVEEGL